MEHIYELKGTETVISPSLIYYERIIRENIKKTIRTAGSPERLRPHVKNHKSMDMVRMQMEYGMTKFKTATVTEVEMATMTSAGGVILAYPLVGPNMERFMKLAKAYPDTVFYGVKDDRAQFEALSKVCVEHDAVLLMLVDVDMGMNRTGAPIEGLEELYRFACSLPGLRLYGVHCYDGNHDNKDAAAGRAEVDDTDRRMADIMERLTGSGVCYELVVAGGAPFFPCHVGCTRWYLFPGTTFVTDAGYYMSLPDLDLIPDAAMMTRVISHPAEGVFTMDLGYKTVASDPAGQRGSIVGLEDAMPIIHSEEHWAFRLEDKNRMPAIGTCLYVIPTHICPATALYPEIPMTKEGRVAARWQVTAKNRKIIYRLYRNKGVFCELY